MFVFAEFAISTHNTNKRGASPGERDSKQNENQKKKINKINNEAPGG